MDRFKASHLKWPALLLLPIVGLAVGILSSYAHFHSQNFRGEGAALMMVYLWPIYFAVAAGGGLAGLIAGVIIFIKAGKQQQNADH